MHRVGKRTLNPEIALHHIFEQPDELSAVRAGAQALHTRCLDRMWAARENRDFTALLELTGDMLRETSGRFVSVPLNFAIWVEMNDAHAAPAGPGAALLGELFGVYVGRSGEGHGILPWEAYLTKAAMTDGLERGGVTRDLACGAGGGLAAFMRLRSVRANQCSVYAGLDADRTCAQMTALNFCFFQVNGVAAWGDSRTREIWEGWANFSLPAQRITRAVPPENFPTVLDAVLFGEVPHPRRMTAVS